MKALNWLRDWWRKFAAETKAEFLRGFKEAEERFFK